MINKYKPQAIVLFASVLFFFTYNVFTQIQTITDGKYTYSIVKNDPTNTRIYKLNNGLTVYLSVYKDEPRIQTYIPVKTGSKMDPHDATGLAHYLEHMLFKGTDKYGTKDFEKEKPLIDEIINLYEKHRATKDIKQRKIIYHQIDSVSGLAAKYAIANEYDKMMSIIGAIGTNAYTSVEQTVYTNDIPSNQLERWLKIEAERFRNPVMRLFHTELEAVYEEKNISLDDDNDKAWDELSRNLFPTHPYGTQTTIGTIEDLKNPSIKKVINYYKTYYVPNNMAIVLSGDLDPEKTIELIDKYWGDKQSSNVPEFISPIEKPILKPIIKNVYGPEAEFVMLAYRFPGANSRENDLASLVDLILANSSAGLLDLNLNQNQKVLTSGSFMVTNKDYSAHVIYGNPREGQKLEDVTKLLLEQVEKVKKGEFPDWLLTAIINDLKLSDIKSQESNRSRAGNMVDAFVKDIPWQDEVNRIGRLSKITKQDIIEFVNKNYGNNYVVVYKRTGEDKNVEKVNKPQITPVEVNRQDKSIFLNEIAEMKPDEINPVFVDYNKDLSKLTIKNNIPFLYKKNEENELFNLNIIYNIGSFNNKLIPLAVSYFSYLGTSKYTPSQLKEEFYKLGCTYSISADDDETVLSLNGLDENFDKSMALLEEVMNDLKPENKALENLVQDILKVRDDDKLNKDKILWSAMLSYGKYGAKSPFTDIYSEQELNSIKPEDLINLLEGLHQFKQKILYYGPENQETITGKLSKEYKSSGDAFKDPPPPAVYPELSTNENNVYIVNYPDMVQAEILLLSKKENYDKEKIPLISVYNEYFGGGMSGIVFQELRESKALAYSTFSSYTIPSKLDNSHYNIAYIGTQSDKLPEAISGLFQLLNDMPVSDLTFTSAKDNLLQKLRTDRITKSSVLSSYLASQKLGLDYDIRKDIYEKAQNITMDDIKKFAAENIKNSKYTILVLGDKNKLDIKTLSKYGNIKYLTLEEIFGY
ncbi:MAG: insulinase family protein [Ignavibacteria bacterium]|nr:insulinase family protein [Ignavibacteria bacterium]